MTTSKTVRDNEISHFNKLASIWWDESEGPNHLHSMNQVRVPMVVDGLLARKLITPEIAASEKPLLGIQILDVGCGGGYLSEALAKLGANITGVDAASALIECARNHANQNDQIKDNIEYLCDTIENFSVENAGKYDVMVASEIIEHVNASNVFLESCLKTLKPNGSAFITTINRTTKSWLLNIILYEYIIKIIAKGTHNWNQLITTEELQKMFNNNKFKVFNMNGWNWSYFTKQWYTTSDMSTYYYMHAIKEE